MREPMHSHQQARYFLKTVRVCGGKESQISTGGGGQMVYDKFRDSAKVCFLVSPCSAAVAGRMEVRQPIAT
eukprot:11227409-Lingulodinium_polyedra.AAC.1